MLDPVVTELCEPGTDAVLGRATDGGYWVIGLRHPRADVLSGVPMSLDTTHEAQLERLLHLGLRTTSVGELGDVDTFDDAIELAATIPEGRFAAAVLVAEQRIGPVPARYRRGGPPRR